MDSLIGDLLDAGRIDTGTLSVAPEPSEVAALVDQARGTFISGGGRHTVRIDLPPDLPLVMADRQRLVQVLNNLLANAARHAPDSAPIRIAAEREGLDVAVSVADEGRGIAPDQLGQLFRKYTTAGDRKGGLGSGLGLAICKGLVEAQGGRIRAESGGVGLGARFTFTIPMAEAASDSPAPARPGPPGHAPDAVPILVVDDDPETLRHLRDTLAEAGYAPLVTGDPGAVARLIQTEKPQLVLLDLMLPGTDGIELMQTVPSSPTCRSSSSRATGATRPSRGRWRPASRTTWSSRSRRPNSRRASGRPCAGGRTPSPSSSASSPSTTTGAGSAWPGAR